MGLLARPRQPISISSTLSSDFNKTNSWLSSFICIMVSQGSRSFIHVMSVSQSVCLSSLSLYNGNATQYYIPFRFGSRLTRSTVDGLSKVKTFQPRKVISPGTWNTSLSCSVPSLYFTCIVYGGLSFQKSPGLTESECSQTCPRLKPRKSRPPRSTPTTSSS